MTPEQRLAQLTQARGERKNELDLPRTMTKREVDAYLAETTLIDVQIQSIRMATDTLAAIDIKPDTTWLDRLTAWRVILSDELLAMKSPIRDRALKARANDLDFCLQLIDYGFGISRLGIATLAPTRLGQLMHEAGYEIEGEALRGPRGWRGSLPEVEERIRVMAQRRAAAQAALDAALTTDEERAAQSAEHGAFRETLKTMRIKADASGTTLVVLDDNGAVVDPSELTAPQRAAFDWHCRSMLPELVAS